MLIGLFTIKKLEITKILRKSNKNYELMTKNMVFTVNAFQRKVHICFYL